MSTNLVTRRDPVDFRAFLQRHHSLLCFGGSWTLRVALPRPFHGLERFVNEHHYLRFQDPLSHRPQPRAWD